MARIPVHADGGLCHGTPLNDGWCDGCGITPDAQSVELWEPHLVAMAEVEQAIVFVDDRGYADPKQCKVLVARIRELEALLPTDSARLVLRLEIMTEDAP